MKVLTAEGRWRSPIKAEFDPVTHGIGIEQDGLIRLTDGPGGFQRFTSYGTIYKSNPWLWAVVNTIARARSRLPLKLYVDEVDDNGHVDRQQIKPGNRSAAERLAMAIEFPSPPSTKAANRTARSTAALWKGTTVDRQVRGNALWRIHDNPAGVTGFERIPWRYVWLDEPNMIYHVARPGDPTMHLTPEEVCHFGLWSGDDRPTNTSPIDSLHSTIALYDAVERHLVAYFKNGARPSANLKVAPEVIKNEKALKAMREEIANLYAGPENAGRVALTAGEWTSITWTPDNAKVIELAKQSREEICGVFGVPPPLAGILDRAIMSNVRELRNHYVRDMVGPDAQLDEGDFRAQVIGMDSRMTGVFAEFDLKAQLRPDLAERSKTFKNQRYVYALNEIRKDEGLPRIDHPDADVPWMPLAEAPITDDRDDEEDDEEDDETFTDMPAEPGNGEEDDA